MCIRDRSYRHLAAIERENRDYVITALRRNAPIAILAPHGGGIEPGTSELARAIAGEDYSLYLFEARKSAGNGALHITSTHFDEPRCLEILRHAVTAVTIHGVDDVDPIVHLGGLDQSLIRRLAAELKSAGFVTSQTDNPAIAGRFDSNICNRGTSGLGCQLEISRGLRLAMFRGLGRDDRRYCTPEFDRFVGAVHAALCFPAERPDALQFSLET